MKLFHKPAFSFRAPARARFAAGSGGWASVLSALGLVWILASCGRDSAANVSAAKPPVPVLAARASQQDVPVDLHAIGTVQAYSLVSIRSQITGPITQVHIREGQVVEKGDPLFTIDPRPWQAALSQAQANLNRDEAQLINARLGFLRTSNLFASKIASQQDYDAAEASYLAQVSTVAADHEAVTNARVSLGYTLIRSPINGRTGNLTIREGNVVKSPDDVILTVAQVHPIYVAFAVPEQNLPSIRRQMRPAPLAISAVMPGDPGSPARGELTFINNLVDTNTGTILLKGTFSNADDELWPGQFVQVSMTLSNLVGATLVPSQAVETGQNGEFVFVIQGDGTVTNQPVATSVTRGGMTVITRGIKPGDSVVTDGQSRLVPGARVTVKSSLDSDSSAVPPPGS
jgi:multidrug efflux system membrane fusion protein